MQVLARMRRDYKVDDSRIYLMGHSMGAIGTWLLGAKYPDIWAALGTLCRHRQPAERRPNAPHPAVCRARRRRPDRAGRRVAHHGGGDEKARRRPRLRRGPRRATTPTSLSRTSPPMFEFFDGKRKTAQVDLANSPVNVRGDADGWERNRAPPEPLNPYASAF